jgi:hypothetical protein
MNVLIGGGKTIKISSGKEQLILQSSSPFGTIPILIQFLHGFVFYNNSICALTCILK